MKRCSRSSKAPLQSHMCGAPLDRIQMDILGPLPESKKGNKYILVIIDQFTKWVEAYPIPYQGSGIVAEKLVQQFISTFGTPLEIHTDQGSNFQSDLIKEVCRLLDITKTRTTPYHPSSNGLVERFNRTLLQMVRCYLDSDQHNWDDHLPLLVAAYRSTPHQSRGFTPNKLMLGREVLQPQDLSFPRPTGKALNTGEYLDHLNESLRLSHDIARHFFSNAQGAVLLTFT